MGMPYIHKLNCPERCLFVLIFNCNPFFLLCHLLDFILQIFAAGLKMVLGTLSKLVCSTLSYPCEESLTDYLNIIFFGFKLHTTGGFDSLALLHLSLKIRIMASTDRIRINVCSETIFLNMQGEGVNTAFVDCVELLEEKEDVRVSVNSQAWGDIMHSHTYGPYYFLRGLNYARRKILTAHVIPDSIKGSLPFVNLFMPFVKWYFKQVYSYADAVIAISPMVEKAVKDLGVKTPVIRIDNPLHLDKWKRTEELRAKGRILLGLRENDFCVLGVGQLQQRKGPEDFIEIGKQLPGAQFRWAGGRPFGALTEGIKRLDQKIAEAPDHIQFAGLFSLADMPSIYAAADMFLFLSHQENCPLAPIEAAASGMPVVYRDIEEYKLLYKNEYCKATTISQFVDWINRLMNDPHLYESGLKISENLITQFDKYFIRQQLLRLYRRIMTGSTNGNSRQQNMILQQIRGKMPQPV